MASLENIYIIYSSTKNVNVYTPTLHVLQREQTDKLYTHPVLPNQSVQYRSIIIVPEFKRQHIHVHVCICWMITYVKYVCTVLTCLVKIAKRYLRQGNNPCKKLPWLQRINIFKGILKEQHSLIVSSYYCTLWLSKRWYSHHTRNV